MSGEITITPGYTFSSADEAINNTKLNQIGNPTALIDADSVTERELSSAVAVVIPSSRAVLYDHWLGPTIGDWTAVNSAGSTAITAGTAEHPGQILVGPIQSSGSDFNGLRGASGTESVVLGGGEVMIEWEIREPTSLSNASDPIEFYVGLANGATNMTEPTNGIYFSYAYDENSGGWVGKTAASSTRTSVNSNTTVATNTWRKLRAVVNAAGTSVEFFVDDVSIGTSTTNIPTAALTPICGMVRTSGTGSGNPSFRIDYVHLSIALTTAL